MIHKPFIFQVSGWGKTEKGVVSEELRTLEIPYKYQEVCMAELPESFADKYYISGKFCAGFHNQNASVCDGDSGNGLAFRNPVDRRYYIHGIVSLAPKMGNECHTQQNALYTKVASYYNFVQQLLERYAPTDDDCLLPPYPRNGKWTVSKQEKKPGDYVSLSTILKIQCDAGFKLSSFTTNIECGSARDLPTCQCK